MHLYCWTILTAICLQSSSGTPLQIENTLVPLATSNITISTENDINPDHYNVAGTDIWLQVLRPYGGLLPPLRTLASLNDTMTAIAEAIADRGDGPLDGSYARMEKSIKIVIEVNPGRGFAMSTAKSAIQGVYELMSGGGGPGTRAITVFVNEPAYGAIGRITISWDRYGIGTAPISNKAPAPTSEAARTTNGPGKADSEAVLVSRATTNTTGAIANGASANITALTPDHYRVPGTSVYVAVIRPYGPGLPHDWTIQLLLSAVYNLADARAAEGDVLLPMEWSIQERGLSVSFKSRDFNRPHLTTMQAGMVGLLDLMEEESVVGTKEVSYSLGSEEKGGMGHGWVRWDVHALSGGNGTSQDVAAATGASLAPSRVLGLGATETELVSTE